MKVWVVRRRGYSFWLLSPLPFTTDDLLGWISEQSLSVCPRWTRRLLGFLPPFDQPVEVELTAKRVKGKRSGR